MIQQDGHEISIVDNFLKHEDWKKIHDHMTSTHFYWFHGKSHHSEEDWSYSQLTHIFYSGVVKENQNPIISIEFGLVQPILNLLSPCTLIRVKANLTTPALSVDNPSKTLHTDSQIKTGITGVYYINSNDRKTIFKDGSEVDSVANRMVLFPNYIEHGVERSAKLDRFVINFNFIKGN